MLLDKRIYMLDYSTLAGHVVLWRCHHGPVVVGGRVVRHMSRDHTVPMCRHQPHVALIPSVDQLRTRGPAALAPFGSTIQVSLGFMADTTSYLPETV